MHAPDRKPLKGILKKRTAKFPEPPDGVPLVGQPIKRRRREATVFDAVAGRISSQGFIPQVPVVARGRDTASSSTKPVPADEVLFRRKRAPVRYQEDDIYCADRDLSSREALPDSDLLKAIHAYASDYYAASRVKRLRLHLRSMEETALIAMGILLEEAVAEALGATGHLVLLEGVREGEYGSSTSHTSHDERHTSKGNPEKQLHRDLPTKRASVDQSAEESSQTSDEPSASSDGDIELPDY